MEIGEVTVKVGVEMTDAAKEMIRQIVREEIAAAEKATTVSFLDTLKDRITCHAATDQQPSEAMRQ